MIMSEQQELKRILAYMTEKNLKTALEAEVKYMATKANVEETAYEAVAKLDFEAIVG